MKEKKHISSFGVPDNYFSTIESRISLRIAEEKFPKSAGFCLPQNYFDTLEPRLEKRLTGAAHPKVRQFIPNRMYTYAAALVACLILVFSLVKSPHSPNDIEAINLSAIDHYIEAGNLDIDLYELINYLSDADEFNFNVETSLLTESAIEEYLFMNLDDQFWIETSFNTP